MIAKLLQVLFAYAAFIGCVAAIALGWPLLVHAKKSLCESDLLSFKIEAKTDSSKFNPSISDKDLDFQKLLEKYGANPKPRQYDAWDHRPSSSIKGK